MAKNRKYRNKPCGYCGRDTGPDGEGEHVISRALFPSITDPRVQWLKIPACPSCNDSWQADEGHFRNVVSFCGATPNSERDEIFQTARRGFRRPDGGFSELMEVAGRLVPQGVLTSSGRPYCKIYPLKDARVVSVIRKIVRGLVYYHTGEIVRDENRVKLIPNAEEPTELGEDIQRVYHVPRIFTAWAFVVGSYDPSFFAHSMWVLKFYDSAVFAAIVAR